MSLGLKTAHRPSPSTPLRVITTSPVYFTETSTQFTSSPRSMITPSPKAFHPDLHSIGRDPCLSTQDSESSLSYKNPNNSLDMWSENHSLSMTTPVKVRKFEIEREVPARSAPKKGKTENYAWVLRKEHKGNSTRSPPFSTDRKNLHPVDIEKELQMTRKALSEKDSLIAELQAIVSELEEKMKAERYEFATLHSENQRLTAQIREMEQDMKTKFAAEIQRLTNVLSENSKKFKDLTRKLHTSPSRKPAAPLVSSPTFTSKQGSVDFSMFLLAENKRIAEEMTAVKLSFQRNFTSLLTSLIEELTSVRHDMVQLNTLLHCIKAGEMVQLDVLWSAKTPKEERKSNSLSTECLKEVTKIKDCTAEMRKVASSFYAEQCGQACSTQ